MFLLSARIMREQVLIENPSFLSNNFGANNERRKSIMSATVKHLSGVIACGVITRPFHFGAFFMLAGGRALPPELT